MMGAISAALALGRELPEALVLGAAAGAVNFLHHGLGTGSRREVEELSVRRRSAPALGLGRKWGLGTSPREDRGRCLLARSTRDAAAASRPQPARRSPRRCAAAFLRARSGRRSPSTWIRPRRARASIPSRAPLRTRNAAVAWIKAPRSTSLRIRSIMSPREVAFGVGDQRLEAHPLKAIDGVAAGNLRVGPASARAGSSRPPPSETARSSSEVRPSSAVSATSPPVTTSTGIRGVAQLPVHLLDAPGELGNADIVVVSDVGRRGDHSRFRRRRPPAPSLAESARSSAPSSIPGRM